MLGTPSLLGFSLRALVLVVAIGLLWTVVAEPYSGFLAAVAEPLVSGETALKAATINAASVVSHVDTQTGLMTREDIEARLEDAPDFPVRKWQL